MRSMLSVFKLAERVGLLGASRLAPSGPPFGRYPRFVAAATPGLLDYEIFPNVWRRGWDSNPRTPVEMLLEFQSSAFDRSATSPINNLRQQPRPIIPTPRLRP